MFSKILIWKKLDHALNTKNCWAIIKTIYFKYNHCNGQKDKEDALQNTVNYFIIVTVQHIDLIGKNPNVWVTVPLNRILYCNEWWRTHLLKRKVNSSVDEILARSAHVRYNCPSLLPGEMFYIEQVAVGRDIPV